MLYLRRWVMKMQIWLADVLNNRLLEPGSSLSRPKEWAQLQAHIPPRSNLLKIHPESNSFGSHKNRRLS